MSRFNLPLHHIFLLSLSLSSPVQAQTDPSVTIDVDATNLAPPLKPVWAYFGYDESNYTTHPEAVELLSDLAAMHAPDPVRVRSHFLFNTGDGTAKLKWGSTNIYTEDAQSNPIYDYSIIDSIMDAALDAGVYPMFQFGFMPKSLSTQPEPYENSSTYVIDGGAFYPPNDYEKWGELVRAYAEHASERYDGTQTNWIWELWNEPDIAYWKGTFEEYARLYDFTEAALHSVLPDAVLGGPAVARPTEGFLSAFLAHCESGTNAVTGEVGTRLDMVSFHAKGGTTYIDREVVMDLGKQLDLHRAGFESIAASEAFRSLPVHITEADPDGCAACSANTARHFGYRNSSAYGAYEVAMMKHTIDQAEAMGINLEGLLTWAFTFPGSEYFAGYRALSTNGIPMPVLNAFRLISQLRGARLPLVSSGALSVEQMIQSKVRDQPDIDGLAAMDGETVRVLVWNYHDVLSDEAVPSQVQLRLALPPEFEGRAVVRHQRVDDEHGDAFSVWEAQGKPVSPSDEQRAALEEAAHHLEFAEEQFIEVEGGEALLSFQLPRFGVSLVTLNPARKSDGESEASGCACRTAVHERTPPMVPFMVLLALALASRLRAAHTGSRASSASRHSWLH